MLGAGMLGCLRTAQPFQIPQQALRGLPEKVRLTFRPLIDVLELILEGRQLRGEIREGSARKSVDEAQQLEEPVVPRLPLRTAVSRLRQLGVQRLPFLDHRYKR